jgi:hypothetical protein
MSGFIMLPVASFLYSACFIIFPAFAASDALLLKNNLHHE